MQTSAPPVRGKRNHVYTSLIGIRGAGKSTCAGLMLLSALDMAEQPEKKLRVLVDERNLAIRTITDEMMEGFFPEPSVEEENFEATITLRYQRKMPWSGTVVRIALNDVAGETLRELMETFQEGRFQIPDMRDLRHINQYILNATVFIMLADMAELVSPKDRETRVPQDAQLSRFIDALVKYKNNQKGSPQLKGVALILTKYDAVEHLLSLHDQISLQDPEGRKAFLVKYMPQTWRNMRDAVGESRTDVFYSFVQPEERDEDDSFRSRLLVDPVYRRPEYSAEQYNLLLEWVGRVLR